MEHVESKKNALNYNMKHLWLVHLEYDAFSKFYSSSISLIASVRKETLGFGFPRSENVLLVGGLFVFFIFPYIGNVIIPTDAHIFQMGTLW